MTTAARAAFGISAMSGASSSRVASAPAAVTSSRELGLRAGARG